MRAAIPVIEALEVYRKERAKYPSELASLTPDFLAKIDDQLFYRLDAQSYALSFTYTGWGISYCEYRPERNWKCQTKH